MASSKVLLSFYGVHSDFFLLAILALLYQFISLFLMLLDHPVKFMDMSTQHKLHLGTWGKKVLNHSIQLWFLFSHLQV